MRITYFGNAMILLEGQNSRILCDPWVTFDRYSSSGLYTFPELKLSRQEVAALKPDFIYVSHTHEDHFDPITLSLFGKETPILVADFENNFTERNVRALGFTDVRVVDGEKGARLNADDWCWMEPNGTYPDVDLLIIAKMDGKTIANLNDNPFEQEQIERLTKRFAPFDLACVPYSFQGPYPAFYENLSVEERTSEAGKKRERNYETMTRFAEVMKPKWLFAFAAGAIYGGTRATLFPFYGVGTASEAIAYAQKRVKFEPVLLSQKCSFDLNTGTREGNYQEITYTSELEYIREIANKKNIFSEGGLFYIAESERIDLTRLLQRARARQKAWQDRRQVISDAVFLLDVGEDTLYRFSLADTTVTRVKESEIDEPFYEIFRVPYSLLIGILTGHYNWSNIKTQHVSFYRKPNKFDPVLHLLMSFLQV